MILVFFIRAHTETQEKHGHSLSLSQELRHIRKSSTAQVICVKRGMTVKDELLKSGASRGKAAMIYFKTVCGFIGRTGNAEKGFCQDRRRINHISNWCPQKYNTEELTTVPKFPVSYFRLLFVPSEHGECLRCLLIRYNVS